MRRERVLSFGGSERFCLDNDSRELHHSHDYVYTHCSNISPPFGIIFYFDIWPAI